MKQAREQRGFTIVETLIVLAVTGLLFVIAAVAVNGEQGRAEFHQAINDVQSEIQQTIDQVAAGDYQNTGNFTCNANGGTLHITGLGTPGQGSNTGCTFLGKVLQFDVKNKPQQYIAYPIAGLQKDSSGNEVTTLAAATPTAIAPGTTTGNGSIPDASVPGTLDNSLTVVSMTGGGNNIGAVAFISSLGQYNSGTLVSGSQQIDLYPVNGSALAQTKVDAVDTIDNHLKSEDSQANPNGGVQICFASGTTDQSGLITIGSNGSNLAVTLQIKNGRNC